MSSPLVSVIVPSYNYADFISVCIESVLAQTFTDFEVIVVDDGSKDNTAEVIERFDDPRVKYIYQENKGLPGARNTGIKASTGPILAFLDSDDKYHPEKLAAHVELLKNNPDVGLSYSGRLTESTSGDPLILRQAPVHVTLKDLVLYYPFTPSDVVMRREWAEKVDLFDESFIFNSEDLNFHLRLALAGCKFMGIPRAFTYRQIHADRIFKNLAGKMETYIRALDTAFKSPDCPADVLALQDEAYSHHYLIWGWQAAVQDEVALADEFLNKAIELQPELLGDNGRQIINFFTQSSTRDGGNHEKKLRLAFQNLPDQLKHLAPQVDACVQNAHLRSATVHMMWQRVDQAKDLFQRAFDQKAKLTDWYLTQLSHDVAMVEAERGETAAQNFMSNMLPYLEKIGPPGVIRTFKGNLFINRAFFAYQHKNYQQVRLNVAKGIMNRPAYLGNRGVLSILMRSFLPSN